MPTLRVIKGIAARWGARASPPMVSMIQCCLASCWPSAVSLIGGFTLPGHADCASCRIGKIDDAAGNVMPSIIDADIDRATVSQVGDANARTKR